MTNSHENDLMDDALDAYLTQQRMADEVLTLIVEIKRFITENAVGPEDEWDNEDLKEIHDRIKTARKLLREIDRLYPAPEGEQ